MEAAPKTASAASKCCFLDIVVSGHAFATLLLAMLRPITLIPTVDVINLMNCGNRTVLAHILYCSPVCGQKFVQKDRTFVDQKDWTFVEDVDRERTQNVDISNDFAQLSLVLSWYNNHA